MALRGDIFTEVNFKKIIEFAPIGIVIIDRKFNWLLVNQRFCEIIGYDRESGRKNERSIQVESEHEIGSVFSILLPHLSTE